MNMEISNEIRVKIEQIWDDSPISDSKRTREDISCDEEIIQPNKRKSQSILSTKVKEEPIDIEIQSSKPLIESRSEEVEVKAEEEEKFSTREEFTNKISIAFLNEETNQETSQATTSKSQSNKPKSK